MSEDWRHAFAQMRLTMELLLIVAMTLAFWRVMDLPLVQREVDEILSGRRSDLYGALLSIHSALLGFVLATFTIVLGYGEGSRLAVVRQSYHWPKLYRSFTGAVRAFAFGTVSTLAALLLDREQEQWPFLLSIVVVITLFSGLRLSVVLVLLERIVTILIQPAARKPGDAR